MNQAFICDGVRTPIGRYGGALAQVRADDLAALPLRVLLERHPQVDWAQLDDVILGCANQAGEDNRNLARMALLLAGVPIGVSGTTVNRTQQIADRISRQAPLALRAAKQALKQAEEIGLSQGLAMERQQFVTLAATDDRREGIAAFFEKRTPNYQGR